MLREVLPLASIQYSAVPGAGKHLSDHTYIMQTPAWSSPGRKAVSLIRAWSGGSHPIKSPVMLKPACCSLPSPNSLVEADQVYASPPSI
jgi:hypothetical protein